MPDLTVQPALLPIVNYARRKSASLRTHKRPADELRRVQAAHNRRARPPFAARRLVSARRYHLPDFEVRLLDLLGAPAIRLIDAVTEQAQTLGGRAYLVGGAVRDLLLGRVSFDIDIVLAGTTAARLTSALAERWGGTTTAYTPFGTAKWHFDNTVETAFGFTAENSPEHLDLVGARGERYPEPTTLPIIHPADMRADLARRDFTINTLAVQIAPIAARGLLLDYYGGVRDLRNGVIRILHAASFRDDPTRLFRLIRFIQRLRFGVEPRTTRLFIKSRTMIAHVTGERLRNEITRSLEERDPARHLRALESTGLLTEIDPGFALFPTLEKRFAQALSLPHGDPFNSAATSVESRLWMQLANGLDPVILERWAERLLFGETAVRRFTAAKTLADDHELHSADLLPSALVQRIETVLGRLNEGDALEVLAAAWVVHARDEFASERLRRYALDWRFVRPMLDGGAIMALGVPVGRQVGRFLARLRAARMDGRTASREDEEALVRLWLAEGNGHDRP